MPTTSITAVSALQFLPAKISINPLREAARSCQGCPLFKDATQTVFGEGRRSARALLVGEQPGHDEDLQGQPFVGPAGRVLDEGLEAAGISRAETYVTNVVKHFKWIPKGKRRIHKKPSAREIAACLPWLEKEIDVIKPQVLVCLGATAARALLGRDFKVSVQRGQVISTPLAPRAVATVHPSSILRQQSAQERRREMDRFTADLKVVAAFSNTKHWAEIRRSVLDTAFRSFSGGPLLPPSYPIEFTGRRVEFPVAGAQSLPQTFL